MKLITFNVWGGRKFDELMAFLQKYNNAIDIFCFQEVYDSADITEHDGIRFNLLTEMGRVLENYHVFFSPVFKNVMPKCGADFRYSFGNAMFISKHGVDMLGRDEFYIHQSDHRADGCEDTIEGTMPVSRIAQKLFFQVSGKNAFLINLHGLYSQEYEKGDFDLRLKQSFEVRKVMETILYGRDRLLVVGDFNMLPDTKSLSILDSEMLNLVKLHHVKSTRTPLYRHFENKPHFADYILTSSNVSVNEFSVLGDVVSDHCPLFVEFF